MTLSDLASIGSLVSGVAVFGSLVLLFFQLRQLNQQVRLAEKNQQAAVRQGRITRSVDIQLARSDPSRADAYRRGLQNPGEITETELTLNETVQDATGEWIERTSTLQLQEKAR